VHLVLTRAHLVRWEELSVPDNAVLFDYAAHDPILRSAALTITHGGRGTLMRSLRHGVPMVVMPGLAGDQTPNATWVQDRGVGLALPGDASAGAIRAAAACARAITAVDGAVDAADEIEEHCALQCAPVAA
jgi:UDP:flavonoid glycosyltransferase YjiC (YdhE family)